MNYPSEGFCRFNQENQPYSPSMERDCVECPVNERDILRYENENTPNNNTSNNNTKSEMMRKIQETEFSAIDLNLFLDTHPDSKEALELYTKLCATLKSLKADYVSKFGPLCAKDSINTAPFQWVETGRKWPWQI